MGCQESVVRPFCFIVFPKLDSYLNCHISSHFYKYPDIHSELGTEAASSSSRYHSLIILSASLAQQLKKWSTYTDMCGIHIYFHIHTKISAKNHLVVNSGLPYSGFQLVMVCFEFLILSPTPHALDVLVEWVKLLSPVLSRSMEISTWVPGNLLALPPCSAIAMETPASGPVIWQDMSESRKDLSTHSLLKSLFFTCLSSTFKQFKKQFVDLFDITFTVYWTGFISTVFEANRFQMSFLSGSDVQSDLEEQGDCTHS